MEPKTIRLTIEVSGCLTTCEHCWAQGGRRYAMPLDDIRRVLEQIGRFCAEEGLVFGADPMSDVLTHPDTAQVLLCFAEASGDKGDFEPIANNGIALATRDDWRDGDEAEKEFQPPSFSRYHQPGLPG